MYKILSLIVILASLADSCTEEKTLRVLQKPIYDFSVRLLERVALEKKEHFIYSPLATWLQLVQIADGAKGKTLEEIFNVTGLQGFRKKSCYRRKFKQIINEMADSGVNGEKSSVFIVDKFYKVKKAFKSEMELLKSVEVLSLDFDNPEKSADIANGVLKNNIKNPDLFADAVSADDFDKRVVLMYDIMYLKSAWEHAFNEAQTKLAPFYAAGVQIGTVNMMNQIGYFKEASLLMINARVLELPCADGGISMLIYLPLKGDISDVFYLLKDTTISGMMNALNVEEPKAVNVSLPKFSMGTEVQNVIELIYDMGVKRAFYPGTAELKRITDSGLINISLMSQMAAVEVTESHVTARYEVESLASDPAIEFNVNRQFAFTLIDKQNEIILFAGMYTKPDVSEYK